MKATKLLTMLNEKFGKVRMVTINGVPYAVAKDIALALGYKNTNDAINKHCKGVVKHEGFKLGGNMASLIPQGDILRLTAKCPLDGAEEFESWIFDTVIPSVLTNGGYINPNATEEQVENLISKWGSKYCTKEIHDARSIRKYIRECDPMKLDECIDKIVEVTEPMKGSIKHNILDSAIKELKKIDSDLMKDTIKHTYIKDTACAGIITLQDVKIGKFKKRIKTLESKAI